MKRKEIVALLRALDGESSLFICFTTTTATYHHAGHCSDAENEGSLSYDNANVFTIPILGSMRLLLRLIIRQCLWKKTRAPLDLFLDMYIVPDNIQHVVAIRTDGSGFCEKARPLLKHTGRVSLKHEHVIFLASEQRPVLVRGSMLKNYTAIPIYQFKQVPIYTIDGIRIAICRAFMPHALALLAGPFGPRLVAWSSRFASLLCFDSLKGCSY